MSLDVYRWDTKRGIKKERRVLRAEHDSLLVSMVGKPEGQIPENWEKLKACRKKLERAESNLLLHKATDLGIDYPTMSNDPNGGPQIQSPTCRSKVE